MTTATEHHRIVDFNVNGGYTTERGTWRQRRPLVVETILSSDPDVVLLQEAHEEKDEHRWIRDAMNAASPRPWRLVTGDGGNHFIIDDSLFKVIKKTTIRLPYDRDFTEVNLYHKPTGVRSWTWNTHLITSDVAKGRTSEMARAMRVEQGRTIADRIARLHRCVGGGDLNEWPMDKGVHLQLSAAGHDDIRSRTTNITNLDYNSRDAYGPNPMEGKWIDYIGAADLVDVHAGGLIDSGDASDHNLLWADVSITGPVTTI